MGIAVIGTVLFASLSGYLGAALQEADADRADRAATVSLVVESAGTAIPDLDADVRRAAQDAFSAATRNAALTGAAFLVAGLAATLTLGRRQTRSAPREHTDTKEVV